MGPQLVFDTYFQFLNNYNKLENNKNALVNGIWQAKSHSNTTITDSVNLTPLHKHKQM